MTDTNNFVGMYYEDDTSNDIGPWTAELTNGS
jgi:hypothetical protein